MEAKDMVSSGLAGQTALVTGAAKRVGREIATPQEARQILGLRASA